MAKSDIEKVTEELRKTLVFANKQARAMGDKLNNDRLKNIARVSNAYVKLLKVSGQGQKAQPGSDPFESGDPGFYDSLTGD